MGDGDPLAIGVLRPNDWIAVDGGNVQAVHDAANNAIPDLRAGKGPAFLWVRMERLSSHTSTDDQKLYRSQEELENLEKGDPLKRWKEQLIDEGVITAEEYDTFDNEIKERIRQEFNDADREKDPSASELELQVTAESPELTGDLLPPGKYRIGDTINRTLRAGLKKDGGRIIFGEDIEDPKGGVFRLTQKLSTEFPKQVYNSPLAESTILGVACGLASYGKRPVFELQFIDFINPGWNQLVTNLSTLRWRSFGTWKCPAVIYAPYGAYLPGGSLWHSQSNEGALAHYPGINVVIPSTPEDAAGLLWTAMHCEDPTFVLIPKHLLWAEHESAEPIRAVPLGQARKRHSGSDVTLVAWGNTIEKSLEALEKIGRNISVELIDLRSIVPWDKETIEESVRKTGRLVVVQEDSENCSVGQMIITHITSQPELWNALVSPPLLISKGNVMIGYNPIYEYAALPDVERIVAALQRSTSTKVERQVHTEVAAPAAAAMEENARHARPRSGNIQEIVVPIMGEGIRAAKVVSLLKQPGDKINYDDALCELETDKAVYPVESSWVGVMGEWKTKVDDTVEIGQQLGSILTEGGEQVSGAHRANGADEKPERKEASRLPKEIEPALSPTITRKLSRVVPTNLQIDARWDAIREARGVAKKSAGKNAASPSAMIAWGVVRAMEKHAPFRRIMLDDDSIVENDPFDLGIAVAIEGDRLATAVITHANTRDWPDFMKRYGEAVEETRTGRVDAMNAQTCPFEAWPFADWLSRA
jgi:2-oxoisovalerate dehydrogenase E1 component